MTRLVNSPDAEVEAIETSLDTKDAAAFYGERNYCPIWVTEAGAANAARLLLYMLQHAEREALDPADYPVSVVEELIDVRETEKLANLEVVLSHALGTYAVDLRHGRLSSGIVFTESKLEPQRLSPPDVLRQAAAASSLYDFVLDLRRLNPIYQRLRDALALYKKAPRSEPQPIVSDGPLLRQGDRSPRVVEVRRRLGLTIPDENADLYDEALVSAVESYQREQGLGVDGMVGPNTLRWLNATNEDRRRTIVINMERARWLPRELGERHVLVDTAGFEVLQFEGQKQVGKMAAVVGGEYNATPMFADMIDYMIVNPYWNVPHSIARDEIVPKMVRDPDYLARNNMEVLSGWSADAYRLDPYRIDWRAAANGSFRFRIRQRPGPENSLGQIKFMFPNKFNIYLHDTPAQDLFEKTRRTFSHGCIRVADPIGLADFLLQGDPEWDGAKVRRAIGGERQRINLKKSVPVYVTYFTAWPDLEGGISFRPDFYGRDAALKAELFGESATPDAD